MIHVDRGSCWSGSSSRKQLAPPFPGSTPVVSGKEPPGLPGRRRPSRATTQAVPGDDAGRLGERRMPFGGTTRVVRGDATRFPGDRPRRSERRSRLSQGTARSVPTDDARRSRGPRAPFPPTPAIVPGHNSHSLPRPRRSFPETVPIVFPNEARRPSRGRRLPDSCLGWSGRSLGPTAGLAKSPAAEAWVVREIGVGAARTGRLHGARALALRGSAALLHEIERHADRRTVRSRGIELGPPCDGRDAACNTPGQPAVAGDAG